MKDLLQKYNVPVPRYTSYPTVPFWGEDPIDSEGWLNHLKQTFEATNQTQGISLYLHLPFCESLCTYCGCNKRITKNHRLEEPYMESLLMEWENYLKHFEQSPSIREIHLGGGTPTFFDPENLKKLVKGVLDTSDIHQPHSFGFEGSPNNTTQDHLETLYQLGFTRVSLGVQDFDPKVQRAVNRINTYDQVAQVVGWAREIGYDSVNLDLIYGLPFQTEETMSKTLELTASLHPDRIALYSYAHVPWKSPSQRGYSEADLPEDKEKRALYEMSKAYFLGKDYVEIGMDHFALETDEITQAYRSGTLHRNFMGYTVSETDVLIGLGVSAISDCKTAYAQNAKVVESYQDQIHHGGTATFRGHFLSPEDQVTRDFIMELICNHQATLPAGFYSKLADSSRQALSIMEQEGLLAITEDQLKVAAVGKPFIRNICSIFDGYLQTPVAAEKLFSKAI